MQQKASYRLGYIFGISAIAMAVALFPRSRDLGFLLLPFYFRSFVLLLSGVLMLFKKSMGWFLFTASIAANIWFEATMIRILQVPQIWPYLVGVSVWLLVGIWYWYQKRHILSGWIGPVFALLKINHD